jgi:hypothetical protein
MKKIILPLITLVLMLTQVEVTNANCNYECTNPWVETTEIIDYNGCSYYVTYKFRECDVPPIRRELKVTKIEIVNDCYYSTDKEALLRTTTRYLLNKSYDIFPSMTGLSNEIHFYTDCCWKHDVGLGEPDDAGFWNPCETDCCCETLVNIDENTWANGEKYYTLGNKVVLSDDYGFNCTTNPSFPAGCKDVCHYWDQIVKNENLLVSTYQCTDTCTAEWGNPDSYPTSNDTCRPAELIYTKRECGGKVQFRFSSFKFNEKSGGCDLTSLIKKAIVRIIRHEAGNYSLPKTFEFNMPTCYEKEVKNGEYFAKVCYWNDNCCLVSYDITETVVPPTDYIAYNYNLDTLNGFVGCGVEVECEFVCDSLYSYMSPYDPLPKKINYNIDKSIFKTDVKVHPNPAKEEINFDIHTDISNKLNIAIYDLSGKLIINKILVNKSNTVEFKLDIDSFNRGTYLFKIRTGEVVLNVGKFIKE